MKSIEKNKIESSIIVDKKPPEVWNALVEFSNYRSWNPVVSHAAIYGTVSTGTEIKILSGKWDLRFFIMESSPPSSLVINGGSIGLKMRMSLMVAPMANGSAINIEAFVGGWMAKLFSKKVRGNIEESLESFLSALKRRVSGGDSYEIMRNDERTSDENDRKGFSMPTPFNLIYKTRKKKSPRRRSRLR